MEQETQQPQSAISGESPELDLDFEPDVGVKRVAEMLRLYLITDRRFNGRILLVDGWFSRHTHTHTHTHTQRERERERKQRRRTDDLPFSACSQGRDGSGVQKSVRGDLGAEG